MIPLIQDALPDIPRIYTALAEWIACVVYIRLTLGLLPRWRIASSLAGGLILIIVVQLVAGQLPTALWIPGMITALLAMFTTIWGASGMSIKDTAYLTARAFVVAELFASLLWQIATFANPSLYPYHPLIVISQTMGYALLAFVVYLLEHQHYTPGETLHLQSRDILTTTVVLILTFTFSNC